MASVVDKTIFLTEKLNQLLPMKVEDQQKLDEKLRLEFNYNSNHLEGNTLTYGETKLLLIFDQTRGFHELREYEEMKAHDVAFGMIKEWAIDQERPITETAIKNLHDILLVRPFWKDAITPDGQPMRRQIKIGNYKEYPNSVRLQNGDIFHYASPVETPIKMGELIQWFRDEDEKKALHPLALAALLHYKFVCIHPFDDGNGRISRLLMNYVLLKYNLPPVIIKSADKRNYLHALNQADAGDLNTFIEYIFNQLIWSLELSIKAANGESIEENDDLQKQIEVWKKGLKNEGSTAAHRDTLSIKDLYSNKLGNLFLLFREQHQQFDDLFWNSEETSIINRKLFSEASQHSLSELPTFITQFETSTFDNKIQSISLQYSLIDFKYNERNSFTIESVINVAFEQYEYSISYKDQTLLTKKYDEALTKEETEAILKACVKILFEEIKLQRTIIIR
jgi:Fic family protein